MKITKVNRQHIVLMFLVATCSTIYSQNIYLFAGNGTYGHSGDGGQATNAQLYDPKGVAVDALGNVYITESSHYVRKVSPTGIITSIAGGGASLGDGGPATSSQLNTPNGIAIDAAGNIYIAEYNGSRVRIINSSGIINTFAGGGPSSAEGVAATNALIAYPSAVAVDQAGNVYISDYSNSKVRKVNTSGIINTIAGTGTFGYSGDGGPATSADISGPVGLAVDATGNVYFADPFNFRIRKISTSGIITTVAGNGTAGYIGDGGQAINAQLGNPQGVSIDAAGNIYIADFGNHTIRKVNTSGVISTFSGNNTWGYSGNGGLASSAVLAQPFNIAIDASNNLFFSDVGNNRIRTICQTSCFTAINKNNFTAQSIKLYPNPSSNFFTVNIDNIDLCEIQVFNSLGQAVTKQSLSPGLNKINTSAFPKGIYSYLIYQNKQTIDKGKLVLE